jgi:phosphoribosylamine-glycine ligase
MTQEEKMKAAVQIMKAVAEAIKEAGSIPSGHLYAQLMGKMSLGSYEKMIDAMQRMGIIRVEDHLITYVGK